MILCRALKFSDYAPLSIELWVLLGLTKSD